MAFDSDVAQRRASVLGDRGWGDSEASTRTPSGERGRRRPGKEMDGGKTVCCIECGMKLMNATRQVPPSVPLAAWETGPSACPIGPHSFNHTLTPELSPYLTTFSGSTQRLLTITASRPYIQFAEDFPLSYLRASERPTICGRFQDTGSSSRTGRLPDSDRFVFDGHCLLPRPAGRHSFDNALGSTVIATLNIPRILHRDMGLTSLPDA